MTNRLYLIDFLTVVFPVSEFSMSQNSEDRNSMEQTIMRVNDYLLEKINMSTEPVLMSGRNGYRHHTPVYIKDTNTPAGFLCIGGNNNTICLTITGQGCQAIGSTGYYHMQNALESLQGHITRVDLAHDVFDGSITLDHVAKWYDEGLFTPQGAGKSPNASLYSDLGSGKGSTFYVGSRKSGKYFRAYEKGKQLGDKGSPWVRLELELRNTKRVIPLEVLTHGNKYLSGAYKCLQFISAEQSRIKTKNNTSVISFKHLEKYAKTSYGRFIQLMLDVFETPDEVINRLALDDSKLPRRLDFTTIPIKE